MIAVVDVALPTACNQEITIHSYIITHNNTIRKCILKNENKRTTKKYDCLLCSQLEASRVKSIMGCSDTLVFVSGLLLLLPLTSK